MKKIILFLIGAMFSQVSAQTKEDRKVADFNELEVGSAIKVILTMSDNESLTLEAEADVLGKIKSEVKNGELNLYLSGRTETNKPIIAYVNAKRIKSISASGASNVKVTNPIKEKEIELEASGASAISAEVESTKLEVEISGAGYMEIKGQAESLELEMSGAANFKASDLISEIVKAKASGASQASINVIQSIDANASGGSRIIFSGSPKNQNLETSGGGSIKKS